MISLEKWTARADRRVLRDLIFPCRTWVLQLRSPVSPHRCRAIALVRSSDGAENTLPTSRIAPARTIVDNGRGQRGAMMAIALVDVLDHLLSPLMLEVDVDVGWLSALDRDEALEQKIR